ncbi:transposase [Streptomyces yokosukanensis]|uniref:transposase n=1 Tax=Streptomyces yokosukanensis TaxID=67386 RepID=UPI001FC94FB3|nr:transposase [Streptomyces yokosukanensis]
MDSTLLASRLERPAGRGSPVRDRRGRRRTDATAGSSRRSSAHDRSLRPINTAGDNPEHLGSEASFAALCGVSPVERSSGRSSGGRRRTAGTAGHRAVRRCRS